MGWIGDTENGQSCWYIVLAPNELVLLTTSIGILPLIVTIVLYSIILYYALHKIVQIKKASTQEDGLQTTNLRIFKGGRRSGNTSTSNNIVEEDNVDLDDKQRKCCISCWNRCCYSKRYVHNVLIEIIIITVIKLNVLL